MRISLTLSRYIARQYIIWFGTFIGGLSVVILIADLLELLRRAASKPEATFGIVLKMALLKLPHTSQELLPFAILFSSIMAFWRLTRSNELVIARAVGISVWQFMLPAIMVVLAIGGLKIMMLNTISAVTFARYEALEAKVLRGQVTQQLGVSTSGLWLRQNVEGGSAILHATHVSQDMTQLSGVTVLMFDPVNTFIARLDAKTAVLKPGYWLLDDTHEAPSGQPSHPVGTYQLPTDYTVEKIQESFARPETMSFWALPAFIDLLEQAGFSSVRHRLYLQRQLATPLLFAAMVLIAATFSLRPSRRGGVGKMIAGGVAAGFFLYFSADLVYALGSSTRIPVMLAAWAPAMVSTLLGLAMLLHLEDG